MQFSSRVSATATLAALALFLPTASVRAERTNEPIEIHVDIRLLVENSEFFREVALDYDGGERYPHLERVAERADLLTPILAPRTP